MTAPGNCPAGYYCPIGSSGTDNKVQCPAGTFSNDIDLSTVTECSDCPPGKYCPIGTTNPSSNNCDAGYYCVKGSTLQAPSSSTYEIGGEINGQCPEGYYCEAGTVSPTPCPKGKYNPSVAGAAISACLDCPAGKYCDEMGISSSAIASKDCRQGFLCIGASTTPTPTDNVVGRICTPGKYCPEGTTVEVNCPGGSYEPRQGTYSSSCQTCPAGYFCVAGSAYPTECPIANYCPEGSAAATLCPAGTYNDNQVRLEASDQCKECPTGYYCQSGVIVDRCNAGYQCDYGATAATDTNKLCPVGFYCPAYDNADCAVVDAVTCAACADVQCKKDSCCLFPIR
jgi:hypothetical protein